MTNDDKPAFARQLFALFSLYGKQPSELQIEAYWQVLSSRLDVEAFERAAGEAGAKCKFTPTPADLLEASGRDLETQASKAWEIVNWAMSAKGAGKNLSFDDHRINATVRAMSGRWDRFIQTYGTREGEQFHRRDFIAEFKRQSGQLSPEAAAPLSGDTELPEVHHIGNDKSSRRCLPVTRQAVAAMLPPRVQQGAGTADGIEEREALIESIKHRIAEKTEHVTEQITDRRRNAVLQRLEHHMSQCDTQ